MLHRQQHRRALKRRSLTEATMLRYRKGVDDISEQSPTPSFQSCHALFVMCTIEPMQDRQTLPKAHRFPKAELPLASAPLESIFDEAPKHEALSLAHFALCPPQSPQPSPHTQTDQSAKAHAAPCPCARHQTESDDVIQTDARAMEQPPRELDETYARYCNTSVFMLKNPSEHRT